LIKLKSRRNIIDVSEALAIFAIKNSDLTASNYNYSDLDEFYYFGNPNNPRYSKLNKKLFKNISYSHGYGIIFNDYNLTWGGIGDFSSCLSIYKLENINPNNINAEIPISKYFFDYLCYELTSRSSFEYINYFQAIIICRLYNTIIRMKLNEKIHLKFIKRFSLNKYKIEIWEILKNGHEFYSFPMFDFGESQKKASSYQIVDFQDPIIKYKFD